MRKKITVVGAGHVGEVTAFKIAEKELGDVILLDAIEDMPIGKGWICAKVDLLGNLIQPLWVQIPMQTRLIPISLLSQQGNPESQG